MSPWSLVANVFTYSAVCLGEGCETKQYLSIFTFSEIKLSFLKNGDIVKQKCETKEYLKTLSLNK